ncbi:hypothetical protein [Falsiroseomonas tokyonensis]|uniref:Uncharacterized protein n=1 Tax=Falsiroseomonas tokyonensis TaxID=430521 RepID=A0ABV7C023_9PROT|nr:hypothetical protein [Falsiroseomonas tokyonensis]MBU8540242.1 hypothetical protein [Falsiroseomonas tokyonensis]
MSKKRGGHDFGNLTPEKKRLWSEEIWRFGALPPDQMRAEAAEHMARWERQERKSDRPNTVKPAGKG